MKDETKLATQVARACASERERCNAPLESPRDFAESVCASLRLQTGLMGVGAFVLFGAALALVIGFLLTSYGMQIEESFPPSMSIFRAADAGDVFRLP